MSNSCKPMDYSPPGSSVHGILQARVLEWNAISFSNGCENWTIKKAERWKTDAFELWCWRRLLRVPWTAVYQVSLSFAISWSLLRLMSVELVMPYSHLILCRPLLLLPSVFPSIRVFSNELALRIRWTKYWSLSFSMSFQWIFKVDFLEDWLVWSPCCRRDTQESSTAPQFESINSSLLSLLYGPFLTSVHNYWKKRSFNH